MSQIRVDPGELAQAAQKFGDLAARLSQLAAETVHAAESAPSYEGQFAPQVQSMGQDAQSRLSQQATRLRTLGEELAATASAFESADQQSIQGFEQLVLQFRGLLDGLGQLLPGGLGATIAAGQPLLGLQPIPPPPEPPAEEEDEEKDWIDRLFDQIRQPEFFWDLITTAPATRWMRHVRNSPTIPLILPMLRGFGMDDLAGPLVRSIDTGLLIRSAGRLIGDAAAPPLFVIGWGLSVAPEQVADLRAGASWNEHAADFVVDSGIFLASEAAGWLGGIGGAFAGTAIGAPELGIPAKFVFDVGTGLGLEWWSDSIDLRPRLTEVIGEAPQGLAVMFSSGVGEGYQVEIPPIPTPSGLFSPTSTPVPLHFTLPTVTLTPAPPSAIATPEPPQVATPSPSD